MTLRTACRLTLSRVVILSAAIVCAAFVAPCPLHGETSTPLCGLLTSLQIKTVLDTAVLEGKAGVPSDGTVDCTWADSKGETRVYLSLKEPGIEYKSFRDSMIATGRVVPVSGLGGDAFYVSSAGNAAALFVLQGKHLLLVTVNGVGFTKVQNESAERSLATEVLPKL